MKAIIFIPMILFLFSCATTKQIEGFDKRKYNIDFDEYTLEYEFQVPKGYTLNKVKNNKTGFTELHFLYTDNSRIYITDNVLLLPNELNASNIYNSGLNKENIVFGEMLKKMGKQEDGRNWLEFVEGGKVSFGYLNVPDDKKFFFDKSIQSLVKIENENRLNLYHESIHTKQ